MSVAKQLNQLQMIDLEVESKEQALQQITSQLGDNQAVVRVQNKLAIETHNLEELRKQQHSAEWEIDSLESKLTTVEKEIYSGRIGNPKELINLQSEIDGLRAKRNQLEDDALKIMEKVELTEAGVATLSNELKTVKTKWHRQQQQLSAEMKEIKTKLSDLKHKRQVLLAEIENRAVELYHALSRQKRQAVAKIEQGICGSCRLSLPITDLQRARSGDLVQCSSCGRILFQA